MSTNTKSKKQVLFLTLAALGVVYGDIGTSPLYAINEIFFGHGHVALSYPFVMGAVSLVVWALTLVISFEYVVFVLRADNDGEGGVFALFSLLQNAKAQKSKSVILLSSMLIFAAGLLLGDGMITPAISVLSAVEGMKVATASLEPYVIPATIVILTGLFLIQRGGTSKVGAVFGPIVLIWFTVIGILGLINVLSYPGILAAINPVHAFNFLTTAGLKNVLWVLGAVMLTITGGEAMYADMGHFGRGPIRLSWFSVVYPALLLNYLGQGAFLLSGSPIHHENIFYSMVPSWGIIPMVVLATMATVIASQSLISGAFSLATQAVALNLLPTLKIIQTHAEHEGQKYVPFINWALYIGCITLVLTFKTSSNLASAYGLAVSGVMVTTTISMILVAKNIWKWRPAYAFLLFIPLACIDSSFLVANSLKFLKGGYIPVAIALVIWTVMRIWHWGRSLMRTTIAGYDGVSIMQLVEMKRNANASIPKAIVFLSRKQIETKIDIVPAFKQMFLDRYGLLPKDLIILTVKIAKVPHMHKDKYLVTKFYDDPEKGSIVSVVVQFGFMEEPQVELVMEALAKHNDINIDEDHKKWLIHALRERVIVPAKTSFMKKTMVRIYRAMYNNSDTTDQYFGLGNRVNLSIEVVPVKVK